MDESPTAATQPAAASLPGQCHRVALPGGGHIMLYRSGPTAPTGTDPTPLLLVHSVNATASAIEMAPVAERQSGRRTVVALDLPGFGLSDKPADGYTPQLMQSAIDAAMDWMARHVAAVPVDLMALSLSCEFAVEATLQRPQRLRSLTLISPTAMEARRAAERYEDGRTRIVPWLRRALQDTTFGRVMFKLLTTRPSMRFFLSGTWGTSKFDIRLLDHGRLCASLPGAEHAALAFISGGLFTRGVIERYRAVPVPMWVVHGTKGSFNDYGGCPSVAGGGPGRPALPVLRTVMDGGAMPHFQFADAFDAAYEQFLKALHTQPTAEQHGTSGDTRLQAHEAGIAP